jgi:hypothetical protein
MTREFPFIEYVIAFVFLPQTGYTRYSFLDGLEYFLRLATQSAWSHFCFGGGVVLFANIGS